MSFGGLGDAIRLFLAVVLPLFSFAHAASVLAGDIFAIGNGRVIRLLALVYSLFVAACMMLALTDYAIALAGIVNVTFWLLARQNGFRLVRSQASDPFLRSSPAGLWRWQFSLGFLLWLPIALSCLFATARLLPPKELTAELVLGILVETIVIMGVFLGTTCFCLRAKAPRIGILFLLVLAWPAAALRWGWPLVCLLGWWPPAADRTWLVLLWGTPMLTLLLLAFRGCGFRLVRLEASKVAEASIV
jgi:hypothetical protein